MKLFAVLLMSVVLAAAASSFSFSIPDRGAAVYDTSGTAPDVRAGYAQVVANAGSTVPAGYLVFSFRSQGVLVSEATVPEMRPILSGRTYAAYYPTVTSGVAMVNPNSTDATVSFYFTPGTSFCDCPNPQTGSFVLPAHSQIARFINEAPFNVQFSPSVGTLTFSSNIPIGVIALRGHINERGEFLMATLPVVDISQPLDLSQPSSHDPAFVPHYADGGGWTTDVILINPLDVAINGDLEFLGSGGSPLHYTIAPRDMANIATSGTASATQSGAIRLTPGDGMPTPTGVSIFSYRNNGVTVSEAGVALQRPAGAYRMFDVEAGRFPGQLQTGVGVLNPSSSTSATVLLELMDETGAFTGMTSTMTIPPLGHVASFMKQLPGFQSIPYPFRGIVRISTSAPSGIAVIGLRGQYNERNDFLITTSVAADETIPASSATALFPHLADGGGYTTEFILFSGSAGQQSFGNLELFTQTGSPF